MVATKALTSVLCVCLFTGSTGVQIQILSMVTSPSRQPTTSLSVRGLSVADHRVAAEWHPTKNGLLRPCDVTQGSGRKVWWLCRKVGPGGVCLKTGCDTVHEWKTSPDDRTRGSGCPFCSGKGKIVCRCRSLGFQRPDLASELVGIDAFTIAAQSNKMATWRCCKVHDGVCLTPGCGTLHQWQSKVNNRFRNGGCPFCSSNSAHGTTLCRCRSLGFKRPDLASELLELDAFSIAAQSNQMVAWRCNKIPDGVCSTPGCGTEHVWEAQPASRTTGRQSDCPFCSANCGNGTVICRCRSLGFKFPELALELVGLDAFTIAAQSSQVVTWCCSKVSQGVCSTPGCGTEHVWKTSPATRLQPAGCPFCSGTGNVVCRCRSLGFKFPELALELVGLNAFAIAAQSNQMVAWRCSKVPDGVCSTPGCGTEHVWEAPPSNRSGVNKRGCPFCSGHGNVVCRCQSLGFKRPDLASELVGLDAFGIAAQSNQVVKWRCSNVPDGVCSTPRCGTEHVWEATVSDRFTGNGCPFCSGKGPTMVICKCRSLGFLHPRLVPELVTSDAFTIYAGSSSKHLWRCGAGHEWQATVSSRTRAQGSDCPVCNVNKAEAWLARLCDEHPAIHSSVPQFVVQCIDTYNGGITRSLKMDHRILLADGTKAMIELDGPQHFGPVAWIPNFDFRDQVCRDLAKNRAARDQGCSILRISYQEYHEIDQWLHMFVQACLDAGPKGQVFMVSNAELYTRLKESSIDLLSTKSQTQNKT
jgi:hypothetical protein